MFPQAYCDILLLLGHLSVKRLSLEMGGMKEETVLYQKLSLHIFQAYQRKNL